MNDRSATTTKDTLFRATSIQPATLIRTFAVGLHQGQRTWFPRKQAGHMTASRQPVQNVEKKTLANQGSPHMARREMVESQREIEGKATQETRFYITSLVLLANEIGPMIRDHWAIENGLHWIMDMVFRDDECRGRTEKTPPKLPK